jgi:hypothetical protein
MIVTPADFVFSLMMIGVDYGTFDTGLRTDVAIGRDVMEPGSDLSILRFSACETTGRDVMEPGSDLSILRFSACETTGRDVIEPGAESVCNRVALDDVVTAIGMVLLRPIAPCAPAIPAEPIACAPPPKPALAPPCA